jgi:N-acetylmuramoyl-L-alanine amidase
MSGATRNRGVKKAPFVVLIGAHMPSVLAEIGFVTNPHDEALLKRADQRQRIAEALFRGVNAYASTLSRLDTARASAH